MFRLNFVHAGRLRVAAASLAVAAMTALAGCNATGVSGGGAMAPGPDARSTGPITGETIGSGPVRVALLLPLSATGNAGQLAQNMRNAAELALRDFNSAGITILLKDDRGTVEGAQAAASAAINEGAELILGPLFARSVSGVGAVARGSRVPVIAFSTDTASAAPGVYLLSFLPQSDVDRIVSYAASRGKRSFAALLPQNAYGTVVEAALQRAVANAGGRVMGIERYALDKVSMQAAATNVAALIKSGTIDAVFMPDAGDAAPFLAQIIASQGIRPGQIAYLGSGQWDDARISGESNLAGAWFPAPEAAGFASFSRRYQAAYGATPIRASSLAYDATSLAAGLASRFGDNRFAAQTLTNPNGFIGIDGAFRLLQNGLNQRGLAVYQVGNGTTTIVDPAPKSFTRTPGM